MQEQYAGIIESISDVLVQLFTAVRVKKEKEKKKNSRHVAKQHV